VVLEHGDDLVDDFHWGMALALALPDPIRVAAALGNCLKTGVNSWDWDTEHAKP
jgi:hypothetical protein